MTLKMRCRRSSAIPLWTRRPAIILIRADEEATIDSSAVAASVALSASLDKSSVAASGGGALAFNSIEGKSNAFIDTSTVDASGDVTIAATNSSVIDALIASAAGSVSIGLGGSSPAFAIGISVADNEIGADDPQEVLAYILNSDVTVGQALSLTADSTSQIDAIVLAGSVALAAFDAIRLCV